MDAYSQVAADATTTLIVPSNIHRSLGPDRRRHEDGADDTTRSAAQHMRKEILRAKRIRCSSTSLQRAAEMRDEQTSGVRIYPCKNIEQVD